MFAVFLLSLTLCPVLTALKCKENEFFDVSVEKCKKCSTCPDQLLSRTCSETSDTLCGLDGNFSFLGSKSAGNEEARDIEVPTVLQSDEEERYWKSLAFALIAVLSALVILTTIVVIVTCHRVRNYTWLCKGVTQEQGSFAIFLVNNFPTDSLPSLIYVSFIVFKWSNLLLIMVFVTIKYFSFLFS